MKKKELVLRIVKIVHDKINNDWDDELAFAKVYELYMEIASKTDTDCWNNILNQIEDKPEDNHYDD